jgi:hypothetical protein
MCRGVLVQHEQCQLAIFATLEVALDGGAADGVSSKLDMPGAMNVLPCAKAGRVARRVIP